MKNTLLIIISCFLFSCGKNEKNTDHIKPSEVSADPDNISGKKVYKNSADGKTYQSDSEWKLYQPDHVKVDTGSVKTKHHILLTDQNEIPNLISIERFAEFINKTEVVVKESMSKSDKKGEILAQVTLTHTDIPKVDISTKDEVDGENIERIFSGIEQIKGYNTQRDSVIFQTLYTINK